MTVRETGWLVAVNECSNRAFTSDVQRHEVCAAGGLHQRHERAELGLDRNRGQVLAVHGGRQNTGFAQVVHLFAGDSALFELDLDGHG